MASALTNIFCNINSLSVITNIFPPIGIEGEELRVIKSQCSSLVKDMVLNFTDGQFISKPESDLNKCMRKYVLEIYNTYKEQMLKNAAQILNEDDDDFTIQKAYSGVVETIVEDREHVNWSRLCMIFTLLAVLAEDQRSKKREISWEQYHYILIKVFRKKKIDVWINNNGGWDGFMDHYHMKNRNKVEPVIWLSTLVLWSLSSLSG